MELATHTPFVPQGVPPVSGRPTRFGASHPFQGVPPVSGRATRFGACHPFRGVPPVSKPFELIAPKAVRPPRPADLSEVRQRSCW